MVGWLGFALVGYMYVMCECILECMYVYTRLSLSQRTVIPNKTHKKVKKKKAKKKNNKQTNKQTKTKQKQKSEARTNEQMNRQTKKKNSTKNVQCKLHSNTRVSRCCFLSSMADSFAFHLLWQAVPFTSLTAESGSQLWVSLSCHI